MPRLKALNRYWKKHPPTHLLVAAYLDYEATDVDETAGAAGDPEAPIEPGRTAWMTGMGGIPASDEFRDAHTRTEALAAVERMFFGNLMEI